MKYPFDIHSRAVALLSVLALILLLDSPAGAQYAVTESTPDKDVATLLDGLPDPLTAEAVRDMVSRLSDGEVRAILLHRLDADVTQQQEAASVDNLLDSIERNAATFWRNSSLLIPQTLAMPGGIAVAFGRLAEGQGAPRLLLIAAIIIGVMIAGYAAERLAGFAVRYFQPQVEMAGAPADGWRAAAIALIAGFAKGLVGLFLFAAVSANLLFAVFPAETSQRLFAMKMLVAVVTVRFGYLVSVLVFAPRHPKQRLVAADDTLAAYLTRQTCLVLGIYGFGFGLLEWMWSTNAPPSVGRFGYWTTLAMNATVIWTTWVARDGISHMLTGGGEVSPAERWFARIWPRVAILLVFLEWLIIIVVAESGYVHLLRLSAIITTLALIIGLPFFDLAFRAIGRSVDPVREGDSQAVIAARRATQAGAIRCARVTLAGLLVFVIVKLWGLDLGELAEMGLGGQIAGRFVEIVLVAIIAYGLYELVNIVVARRLVLEAAAAGDSNSVAGDEGGGGGSRLGTLLPLLRRTAQVAILVLALLAILGNLGVNIAPLLAGAGIVGLAIGFGAQTLVKDIVSGVFFLADDAFRIGEYIDVGDVMGTVEKISIRSLRLRHHLGAVHTVPYGDIPKLTNYSRDWVIVKLKFRVPFDTDITQVKRIFKQIGKDLWAHPDLGPDFLDPFKSQGVFDVDDSAIIVRGKFTAKPGRQFLIKREIFVRVQHAFDAAGIPFARRQVLVHMPGDERIDDPQARQSIASAAAEASQEQPPAGDGERLGAPA